MRRRVVEALGPHFTRLGAIQEGHRPVALKGG
jgi:hypothetical protein